MSLHSPRNVTAFFFSLIVLGIGSEVLAQTPSLDVYYYKFDPKDTFKYKWQGESRICNVGAFRWIVPASTFGTGGFDRNFTGYCADVDKSVSAGVVYRFRPISLMDPHALRPGSRHRKGSVRPNAAPP